MYSLIEEYRALPEQASALPEDKEAIKLSELLGALSYALDLTDGQPIGHCVRTTWIAMAIGKSLGLPDTQMWELYYTALLKDLGCSSNAARICELFLSDDMSFKKGYKALDSSYMKLFRFVASQTGQKTSFLERVRAIANAVQNQSAIEDDLIQTRCNRGSEIAASLRFPPGVCDGIFSLDEHWDGTGRPDRLTGTSIPVYSQIVLLAQVVDIIHSSAGRKAAVAEIRERSGNWFDPRLVKHFMKVARAESLWQILKQDDIADEVYALAPGRDAILVDEDYLDDIARAFAQIIDSKSPFTSGHSRRVALYSEMIAQEMNYSAERRRRLGRAALLHDIGKLGVSNLILDKNGKLDDEEWVQMKAHAVWSERILARVSVLRDIAVIGGAHHERLDGKGYPKGLSGEEIEIDTRIVSVADVFDALTADRPYRAAMPVDKALDIMRRDVGLAFDPVCFKALERVVESIELVANR